MSFFIFMLVVIGIVFLYKQGKKVYDVISIGESLYKRLDDLSFKIMDAELDAQLATVQNTLHDLVEATKKDYRQANKLREFSHSCSDIILMAERLVNCQLINPANTAEFKHMKRKIFIQAEKIMLGQNVLDTVGLDFGLPEEIPQPAFDFNTELLNKAKLDCEALRGLVGKIEDEEMREQLQKMQAIAGNIIGYMEKHPDKIPAAERFVNYYQDRARELSNDFLEFQEMRLDRPEINKVKEDIKQTLTSFDEAYEEQFVNMVQGRILEVQSELQIARKIMDEFGIRNRED